MKIVIVIFLLFSQLAFAQQDKSNLFGFATSNTFAYWDVKDTSFLNKVIALNPKLLRFPGGAVGNFYHYGKSGYGFDFEEIDKYDAGRFSKRSRGLVKSTIKKGHTHNYLDDFIVLAKKTNAKAVLVANMFVDNDDIIKMIEKIKSNNIDIVGVELGSELSNRTFFAKGYTINDYIKSAKKCSDKIKEKFPNIKTAIVAAPLVNKKNHRHTVWNNKLVKMDFYDAIIIHSYARVVKGKKEFGQMLTEIPEGNSKEEAFDLYKARIIKYFSKDYPNEVQEYYGLFKKPIWVTEWNLQISWTTGNTTLQSLYVAQYFLELLSNTQLENIELTTFHNLGGRDYSGSIFRNNSDTLEIQSTYNTLNIIGSVFHYDNISVRKEVIKDQIYKYQIFSKQKRVAQLVINWSDKKYLSRNKPSKKVKIISNYSTNLFDKANINGGLMSQSYIMQHDFLVECLPYSLTLTTYLDE